MLNPRRVRHDLDLTIVGDHQDGQDHGVPLPLRGRVVAYEDGRWSLGVPVAGQWIELTGDRWSNGRAVALVLLRAGEVGAT